MANCYSPKTSTSAGVGLFALSFAPIFLEQKDTASIPHTKP